MHTSTRECSWRALLLDDVIRKASGPPPGMESGKPWQVLSGAGSQHSCSLVTVSGAECGTSYPQQSVLFLLALIEPTSLEQEKFKLLFCRDIGKKGTACLHSSYRRLTRDCEQFYLFCFREGLLVFSIIHEHCWEIKFSTALLEITTGMDTLAFAGVQNDCSPHGSCLHSCPRSRRNPPQN